MTKRLVLVAAVGATAIAAGQFAAQNSTDDLGNGSKGTSAQSSNAASGQTADAEGFGCQTHAERRPWGLTDLRTWTPRRTEEFEHPADNRASAAGPPFRARLIEAIGIDYGTARRSIVLEAEDGCRRQYRSESFSDEDNVYVDGEAAKHPTVPDTAKYAVLYDPRGVDGKPLTSPELLASGDLKVHLTQHFAIWYGNGDYEFAAEMRRQGRTVEQAIIEAGEWLERNWYINRDTIGAPMPYAGLQQRWKLNIYVCGTGRPNIGGDKSGCGAGAGVAMGISGWGMHKGDGVLSHEFTHMIQYYSGGFRDRPAAGPIWEVGAQFTAHTINPSWMNFYWKYPNNFELGPFFSPVRYEAFPFMEYLYETDRTRDLVWGAWKTTVTDGAWSNVTKDFVPTLVRAGRKTGAYPNGFSSFADDMGWYGARLVVMDFFNQRSLLNALHPTPSLLNIGHFFTPLVAAAGDATQFAPPQERALHQYGTNIVPLTPSGGKVTVTLTGGTKANAAAWRFSLVAVKSGNVPVYSALGKAEGTGTGWTTLTVPEGAKLYLAVTATPYKYESLGWQEDGKPAAGTTFPYTVRIDGAAPHQAPVTACDPGISPNTWHANYTLSGNRDRWLPC